MTVAVSIAPQPIQQVISSAGVPVAGGSILTQVSGVNYPVYQDQGVTPLPNPIPLNDRGEVSNASGLSCQMFLVQGVVYQFTYFDAQGNQFDQASYVATPTADTASSIGLLLYPVLPIEGSTVVNPWYPYGYINRYGTNAIPGTTDMSAALQAAINQNLAGGAAVVIQGACNILTQPGFTGAPTDELSNLEIYGLPGNQLILNATSGTGPLLNLLGVSGFYLHDLILSGNSANKGDGIWIGESGTGSEGVNWIVERVTCYMAGVGIKLTDCNDGTVRGYKGWPNDAPPLTVPQTVNPSDIGYHLWVTGGFAQVLSFYDIVCFPSRNFFGGTNLHRGVQIDAPSTIALTFIRGDFETYGGNITNITFTGAPSGSSGTVTGWTGGAASAVFTFSDGEIRGGAITSGGACTWSPALTGSPTTAATISGTEVGFAVASASGVTQQLTMIGCDFEYTQLQLANVLNSTFIGLTDGQTGGSIIGNTAVRNNKFLGCEMAAFQQLQSNSYGNTWEQCSSRYTWIDNTIGGTGPSDRRVMCIGPTGGLIRDWGGTDATNFTVTAAGLINSGSTAGVIDCWPSNYYRITETAAAIAFPVPMPINPVVGYELTIVIINSTGGSGVQPTFAAGYHMTSNTPAIPANGNETTFKFIYDGNTFNEQTTPAATVPV